MVTSANPLRDLGLAPGSTQKDVTCAFRRLARQNHPDKGGSKEAFQRICAAYEALTKHGGLERAIRYADPARRAADDNSERLLKERVLQQARKYFATAAAAAKAQRIAKGERVARQSASSGATGPSSSQVASDQRCGESRKRQRQQEEEERRYPEEWKRLRQEQAELKAQQQEQLARRKAKWAAQHNAHISGVSLRLLMAMPQRVAQTACGQPSRRTEPKAPPLARCLQTKKYASRRAG